jgi:hypothetical protein
MGQAKRKREQTAIEACLCGSGKEAATCCFIGGRFHRKPATIVLTDAGRSGAIEGCYLASTGSCGEGASREHLVSQSVLKVIQKEKLRVQGLPWQEPGIWMEIGLQTLTSHCLCRTHNSALSPLDSTAAQFFAELEKADLHRSAPGRRVLISGHDIERWALKTLLAAGHSKSLKDEDGDKLPPRFHPSIDFASLLSNSNAWPPGAGLYFTLPKGSGFRREDGVAFAALMMPETQEIMGVRMLIQGIQFDVLAATPPKLNYAGYRPSALRFKHESFDNVVELFWEDLRNHTEVVFEFDGIGKPSSAPWI